MKNFVAILILTSLMIFFFAILFLAFSYESSDKNEADILDSALSALKKISAQNFEKEQDSKNQITVVAVGDIMLDRGVEYMIEKYGNGDYNFPFEKTADYLNGADITFANLESLISDKGRKIGSACCSFRADPKATEALFYSGFDVVSAANNHMNDYTNSALEDSLVRLQEAGIAYVGAGFNKNEAYSVKIFGVKETKIGFMGFVNSPSKSWEAQEDQSGAALLVDENDIGKAVEYVKEAKKQVDILIVSSHAGVEYAKEPNSFQDLFYKACIDAGADIIIGHHPHVSQPIEKYKEGWIAYSLGNFIFDQNFSEETMKGIIMEITISDKKIKGVGSKEFKINEYYQPEFLSY